MRKVVIASPLATQSGYGHHAREFITNSMELMTRAELGENQWDIKLVSLPWGHTPFTYPLPLHWQTAMIGLPLHEQPEVWVQITVPNEFQNVGKYNIGVTAGTEGDVCPKEWIESIYKMDVVIVPSHFTKTVFENTAKAHNMGITCKLRVVNEYFRESVYSTQLESAQKASERIPELDNISESWCFLAVGHWLTGILNEDRKNVSGLIYNFFNTYKGKSNAPGLILKTSGATYSVTDRYEIENKINQIQDLFGTRKLPNVYLVHGDLSDAEMNSLYNHPKVKAMVSFTRAEGFGRPLLEFSTTGKPIIAPYYSGQVDFLHPEYICRLAGGLTPIHESAQNKFLIGESKWFTVDHTHASKMMKDVQKHYNKWLVSAKKQRVHVNKRFTKKHIQETQYTLVFKEILDDLENIPRQLEIKLPKLTLPKLTTV